VIQPRINLELGSSRGLTWSSLI